LRRNRQAARREIAGRACVAALYDIHGNLPALQAVLAEIDLLRVDTIVVGGDVASGPMPVETLEALCERESFFVRKERRSRPRPRRGGRR
jgi:Icc-related predicted phosphoesterase